jgi:uncharacterized protein YbaA (DUF1428 family)
MGEGSIRRFPEMADAGPDDSVVFAYADYESRKHRDEVNEKVMATLNTNEGDQPMSFDPGKMASGGFEELVRFEA